MPAPQQFLQYIDDNADSFIKRLGEAVAIPRYAAQLWAPTSVF